MKVYSLAFLLLFISASVSAQSFLWAQATKGPLGPSYAFGLVTDAFANVFVTGRFTDQITIGTITLKGDGLTHFLAKLDKNGNVIWAKALDGYFLSEIVIDNSGNISASGGFNIFSVTVGTTTFFNTSFGTDLLVVKYDTYGNVLWARSKSAEYDFSAYDTATDANGNIFVCGLFHDGNTLLDFFVLKYSPAGEELLFLSSKGSGIEIANAIAVDKNGDIFITGEFTGELAFNNSSLENTSQSPYLIDGFVIKFNSDGTTAWVSQVTGIKNALPNDLAVDMQGNVYITGFFEYMADFGNIHLTADSARFGSFDSFIVKYDAAGIPEWGRTSATARVSVFGRTIKVAPSGNIYVGGDFGHQYSSYENQYVLSCGEYDVMIACYDNRGTILDVAKIGGPGRDFVRNLHVDNEGNCVVIGNFGGPVTFAGPYTITHQGELNISIFKLGPMPWRYGGLSISTPASINCSKSLSVAVNTSCSGFPYTPNVWDSPAAVEISKVNSESFSDPPRIIGHNTSSPIVCTLPDNMISGTYKIRVIHDGVVSSNTETVVIECQPEPHDPDVFIPNVFSPNDDSKNDVFTVSYDGTDAVKIEIFNRWGHKVAVTDSIQGWSGDGLPSGIYFYHVSIGAREFRGWVNLLR